MINNQEMQNQVNKIQKLQSMICLQASFITAIDRSRFIRYFIFVGNSIIFTAMAALMEVQGSNPGLGYPVMGCDFI